jgi:hypothetical protein
MIVVAIVVIICGGVVWFVLFTRQSSPPPEGGTSSDTSPESYTFSESVISSNVSSENDTSVRTSSESGTVSENHVVDTNPLLTFENLIYDNATYSVKGNVVNLNELDFDANRYKAVLFIDVAGRLYAKPAFRAGAMQELSSLTHAAETGVYEFEIRAYHPDSRGSDITAEFFELYLIDAETYPGLANMSDTETAAQFSLASFRGETSNDAEPPGVSQAQTQQEQVEPPQPVQAQEPQPVQTQPQPVQVPPPVEAPVTPAIPAATDFVNVKYGSDRYVTGRLNLADGQNYDDYRIILFILLDQYYVKPDYRPANKDSYMIAPGSDGSFKIRAYHPDAPNDTNAAEFKLVLVPKDFAGISAQYMVDDALAAAVTREDGSKVVYDGFTGN